MSYSDLPGTITNSQCTAIKHLTSTHSFVQYKATLANKTLVMFADTHEIAITKQGRVISKVITEEAIQCYFNSLHEAKLLYHIEDDINSIVWHEDLATPSTIQLAQMSTAQDVILAWADEHDIDVFMLYPAEVTDTWL